MNRRYEGKSNTIVAIVIVIVLLLVGFFFWNKVHAENAISGTVEFTGILPDEMAEGIVVIETREHDEINFEEVEEMDMWDELDWIWDGSERGKNYDIRAKLIIDNDEVARSNIVKVSAPADNEDLELDLNLENLPDELHEGALAAHGEFVNMDGLLNINGHIPEGSHVKVYTKTLDDGYVDIKGNFSTAKGTKWNWDSAEPGVRYTIVAQLVNSAGHVVGESRSIHASAPATGQDLTIESNAHHANKDDGSHHKATVSGKINLNGPTEKHSSIRILYRLPGETDFKLADKIDAEDHEKWEWKSAQSGQRYEMTACYAIEDKCQSVSHHQFVNAPASHVKFTVNTELTLHKPHHKPELKECVKNGNKYTARIEIPHEKEARSYLVQVGERSGHHDVYDHKKDRSEHADEFDITVDVDPGKHYYAQYAWAACHDCGDDNYSHFSHNLRFSCGEEGEKIARVTPKANTHEDAHPKHLEAGVKGYKWDANKKACVETADKDAPYAHTNAGLAQCQKSQAKTGTDTHPNVVNNIDESTHTDSHNVINIIQKAKDAVTGNTTKDTATTKTATPNWVKDAKKKCKDAGGHMTYAKSKSGDEYRICKLDSGDKCAAKALLDGTCSLSITTSSDAPQESEVDEVVVATQKHEEAQKKTAEAEAEHKKAAEEHKKVEAHKKAEAKKKADEAKVKLEVAKKQEEEHKKVLEEKKAKQAKVDAQKKADEIKAVAKKKVTQEKKKVTVQKTTDLTHEAAQACVIHGGITSPDTSLIGGIVHAADEALGICTFADGTKCTNAEVLHNGRCITLKDKIKK